ncbi:hypothetical protein NE237_019438 [Protea cynaroides]|uniref:RING-type domain-containing protein n=1 Tax=Protea cynaroides TaxID=273540 RepID=A0A9Q0QQ44_9MAGN|nr:hypothetical protein NE237_019438 [Protea cynaroides]
MRNQEMDGPPENDSCSICHDDFNLPCQANCSHWFCGNCILRVWHHGSALGPCKCPICRRIITVLIPCETLLQNRREPDVWEVLHDIQRYNRSFGGGSNGLIQKLRDMPFFLRRLSRELVDPQRSLPLFFKLRMFLAVKSMQLLCKLKITILPTYFVCFICISDYL